MDKDKIMNTLKIVKKALMRGQPQIKGALVMQDFEYAIFRIDDLLESLEKEASNAK